VRFRNECHGRKDAVQRYSMLDRFKGEGNANVKAIGERFANLRGNYERFGGRIAEAFGAVGDFDVVIHFDAPDLTEVKRIDTAGKRAGMVNTKVLPLFSMGDLRATMEEL
jgi:uncharacterized protein with GYD domain